MILTDQMHDSVVNSAVGQFIDRLIREEAARGGETRFDGSGSVIQALWAAFMAGQEMKPAVGSFREIKEGMKNGSSL